jgi:hypothetical protein
MRRGAIACAIWNARRARRLGSRSPTSTSPRLPINGRSPAFGARGRSPSAIALLSVAARKSSVMPVDDTFTTAPRRRSDAIHLTDSAGRSRASAPISARGSAETCTRPPLGSFARSRLNVLSRMRLSLRFIASACSRIPRSVAATTASPSTAAYRFSFGFS